MIPEKPSLKSSKGWGGVGFLGNGAKPPTHQVSDYLLARHAEPFFIDRRIVTNIQTLMSETCASVRTPWRHSRSMSPWDTSNLCTSTDRTLRNAFRNDPWIGTCDNTTITAVTSTSSGCNVITGCYCCWLGHSLDSCTGTTDAQFPWLLSLSPPHPDPDTLLKTQSLSQVHFKSPLKIHTHNTETEKHNMKHSISSHSHCTVQPLFRQSSLFSDMRPCRKICPSIDRLRIESNSITVVLVSSLFPLPRYYREVCPRYRHYRGKIYSVVTVTMVLPLSPLPCSSLSLV